MSLSSALVLILLVGLVLLLFATSVPKQAGRLLTILILGLICTATSTLMYYIQPAPGSYMDLERITDEMHQIQGGKFSQVAEAYSLNPLSTIYIAFAAELNNVNILKFISAFVFVGSFFALLYLEWYRHAISSLALCITAVLCVALINLPLTVAGVRWGPASALAILGAYLRIMYRRKVGWVFLIIATLLHFSSVFIVLMTVCALFMKRTLYKLFSILIVCYTFISYAVVQVAASTGNSAMKLMLLKMNGYYAFGSDFTLFASGLSQLVSFMKLFICISIYILIFYIRGKNLMCKSIYVKYFTLLLLVCIGSIPTGTPFRRFVAIALYASFPLLGWLITYLLNSVHASKSCVVVNEDGGMGHASIQNKYIFYILFTLLITAISLSIFYDWHSYTLMYLSTKQVYL